MNDNNTAKHVPKIYKDGRYLNKFHEESSKALKESISKQPLIAAKEAYEDYDRTVKRKRNDEDLKSE